MLVWYSTHDSLKERTSAYERWCHKMCKREKMAKERFFISDCNFASLPTRMRVQKCTIHILYRYCGHISYKQKYIWNTLLNILRNSNSQICWLSFAHLTYHCDTSHLPLWPNKRNKGRKETFRKRFKYFWVSNNPVFTESHRCIWKTNIGHIYR